MGIQVFTVSVCRTCRCETYTVYPSIAVHTRIQAYTLNRLAVYPRLRVNSTRIQQLT